MTFCQAREYCESFINYEYHLQKVKSSSFSLQNIKHLLSLIGNPQERLKIIHVAGSKGKGSTCAMIASILHRAGYRTGLYTSPHLESVTERIRVLGDNKGKGVFVDAISEEDFCTVIEELKPFIEEIECLTYFEILTALALFYFARQKVDFVVLETGMGGRLDATNVGMAKVCAITPIGLEHVNTLGNTLEKIAYEKVAIVKDPRQKVVVAPQTKEAEDVIKSHCVDLNIQPFWVGRNIEYVLYAQELGDGQRFFVKGRCAMYKDLFMPLLGKHQTLNAATAVGVVECLKDLGEKISITAIEEGLANVNWPGRFEVVQKQPLIILDCAHTIDSARAVVKTFQFIWADKKSILILGISDDKDKKAIGMELNKIADKVIVTKSNHPRACFFTEENLKLIFFKKKCCQTSNVKEALKLACRESVKGDIIFVTGSIFVVSEARKLCNQKQTPGVCLVNRLLI